MPRVHFGLGTNIGDREANLRTALDELRQTVVIDAISSIYRSEPVGHREQPDFWNLVVRGRTGLAPETLLAAVKRIEREMGRTRSFRDAPRVIDIDILLYGTRRISTPSLEVPHPRMLERAFVLRPLAEVDPGLRHPGTGTRIADQLAGAGELERTERLFPGSRLLDAPRRTR